jgi:hypothetical protein
MTTPEGMMFKASSQLSDSVLTHAPNCHCEVLPNNSLSTREIVLPRVNTYGEARKKAIEIIGNTDPHLGTPYVGKFGVCKNKIAGIRWNGDKTVIRLDWDSVKGPHLNVTDYRLAEGLQEVSVAIPFKGSEITLNKLLNHLNTQACLKRAQNIFASLGWTKDLQRIEKTMLEMSKPRRLREVIKICNREY